MATSVEDETIMLKRNADMACLALVAAVLFFSFTPPAFSQSDSQSDSHAQPQRPAEIPRLTIEVTAGDDNVPVENASVYVKFVERRKFWKDKKYELNVKTNREGIAHIPDPPLGKVLIQIIAEGWRTYGQSYEITDQKQVIKIHLEKPPKWY
jgi:hypothetical protein